MRLFGKKPKAAKARFSLPMWIKARFDAAQTTKDNARHWAAAEFLSADAEADPAVRKILRTRARYEVQNNSYARGIVSTLANDSVGTGPRLQMLLDSTTSPSGRSASTSRRSSARCGWPGARTASRSPSWRRTRI